MNEGYSEENNEGSDNFEDFFKKIQNAQKDFFAKQYVETVEMLRNSNDTLWDIHEKVLDFLKNVELMKRLNSNPEEQMKISVEFAESIKESIVEWDYEALSLSIKSSGMEVPVEVLKMEQENIELLDTMEHGDIIECPWCGEGHDVKSSIDSSNGKMTNKAMFFDCPTEGKSGIAGVQGRSVMDFHKGGDKDG